MSNGISSDSGDKLDSVSPVGVVSADGSGTDTDSGGTPAPTVAGLIPEGISADDKNELLVWGYKVFVIAAAVWVETLLVLDWLAQIQKQPFDIKDWEMALFVMAFGGGSLKWLISRFGKQKK